MSDKKEISEYMAMWAGEIFPDKKPRFETKGDDIYLFLTARDHYLYEDKKWGDLFKKHSILKSIFEEHLQGRFKYISCFFESKDMEYAFEIQLKKTYWNISIVQKVSGSFTYLSDKVVVSLPNEVFSLVRDVINITKKNHVDRLKILLEDNFIRAAGMPSLKKRL